MTKTRKTPAIAIVSNENEKTHLYSNGKKYYSHAHRYLTVKQVNCIYQACETAYEHGTPLNRFFTIHYNDYADLKNPQKFMTDILDRSRKWLKYRGLPVAYVYVIENGKIKGIHGHLLIHIPAPYQTKYKQALKGWLPFEWNKRRVDVKTIKYPPYGLLSHHSRIYGLLQYMCKGINPKTPVRGIKPRYQGEIFGKRWGINKELYSQINITL